MPNWTSNGVTLYHKDKTMIERASKALADGKLFQEFVPCPQELLDSTASYSDEYKDQNEANLAKYGYANWYDFNVGEWSTKWDASPYVNEISEDGHTLECSYDTAWSPPIGFYEKMEELGFSVTAYYFEPGMGFVGKYMDGYDESYEYHDETSETVRDLIGEELDDYFGISEDMRNWEEENEEE